MALKFLIDLLTGNLVLVNVPTAVAPSTTGTFLYADNSGFAFSDGTNVDFVT